MPVFPSRLRLEPIFEISQDLNESHPHEAQLVQNIDHYPSKLKLYYGFCLQYFFFGILFTFEIALRITLNWESTGDSVTSSTPPSPSPLPVPPPFILTEPTPTSPSNTSSYHEADEGTQPTDQIPPTVEESALMLIPSPHITTTPDHLNDITPGIRTPPNLSVQTARLASRLEQRRASTMSYPSLVSATSAPQIADPPLLMSPLPIQSTSSSPTSNSPLFNITLQEIPSWVPHLYDLTETR
jgi:hypothetical protein